MAATINRRITGKDELYRDAAQEFGAALDRLARAYEFDPDKRRDLLQEIHLALWQSFAGFDGRCSLRTWVYRVAHNIAATYVLRQRRSRAHFGVGLEELENFAVPPKLESGNSLEQLFQLIHTLNALDRQVILSYLEGLDGAAIGEITGLSASNIATKIHRIKNLLRQRFEQGERNAQ